MSSRLVKIGSLFLGMSRGTVALVTRFFFNFAAGIFFVRKIHYLA